MRCASNFVSRQADQIPCCCQGLALSRYDRDQSEQGLSEYTVVADRERMVCKGGAGEVEGRVYPEGGEIDGLQSKEAQQKK